MMWKIPVNSQNLFYWQLLLLASIDRIGESFRLPAGKESVVTRIRLFFEASLYDDVNFLISSAALDVISWCSTFDSLRTFLILPPASFPVTPADGAGNLSLVFATSTSITQNFRSISDPSDNIRQLDTWKLKYSIIFPFASIQCYPKVDYRHFVIPKQWYSQKESYCFYCRCCMRRLALTPT